MNNAISIMPALPALADKAHLRKHMLSQRLRLARAQPDAGDRLAERFPLSLIQPGQIVAGYIRTGSEIDPAALLTRLHNHHAQIALPCLENNRMVFRLWDMDKSRLIPAPCGIFQIAPDAPQIHPDCVLLPLLAFDHKGHRLGRGGGHYDKILARVSPHSPMPLRIGLAYQEQAVAHVPTQHHDVSLNRIETPLRSCIIDHYSRMELNQNGLHLGPKDS